MRRYIFENQGLVRRMYGDERHSLIVGRELEARRLRYDDDVNLFGQPFTGRAVHKVRPNSRYAARLKNPSATQDGEVPSATFPTTLTTPPTTAKEHVRTPGLVTGFVFSFPLEGVLRGCVVVRPAWNYTVFRKISYHLCHVM